MARLPEKIATAVLAYVDGRLAAEAGRRSKPLGGELEGMRNARNGDYRILFRVAEDPATIAIVRVAHRAHAYRPR
jgi:mRNA-degrading endonuclease RelE of RelBE toxin-antitoxin system